MSGTSVGKLKIVSEEMLRDHSDQVESATSSRKVLGLKANQQYSERLSAISHFSSEIAASLNNSLTPIVGYSQLLSQGQCNGSQREKLGKITEAAFQAKEIIEGLLTFANDQVPQLIQVDLNMVIRETVGWAEDFLSLPKQNVSLKLEEELQPVLGDPHQLTQALLQLLKNAKQSGEGKKCKIEVTTENSEEGVRLSVRDNGCGMPQSVLPKILLPFFTTRGDDSVGLGLSIANGIVEAHGAELVLSPRYKV